MDILLDIVLSLRVGQASPRRVPAVYLGWVNMGFLAFLAFNRINNLRIFSVAFSSIPTAPTNHLPDWSGFNEFARGQKGADKAIDPVLVR